MGVREEEGGSVDRWVSGSVDRWVGNKWVGGRQGQCVGGWQDQWIGLMATGVFDPDQKYSENISENIWTIPGNFYKFIPGHCALINKVAGRARWINDQNVEKHKRDNVIVPRIRYFHTLYPVPRIPPLTPYPVPVYSAYNPIYQIR